MLDVRDAPERSRYEGFLDGDRVAILDYRRSADALLLTHAEVDHRVGGRGIGTELVEKSLADLRNKGERSVVPVCSFVAQYMATHPETGDLAG